MQAAVHPGAVQHKPVPCRAVRPGARHHSGHHQSWASHRPFLLSKSLRLAASELQDPHIAALILLLQWLDCRPGRCTSAAAKRDPPAHAHAKSAEMPSYHAQLLPMTARSMQPVLRQQQGLTVSQRSYSRLNCSLPLTCSRRSVSARGSMLAYDSMSPCITGPGGSFCRQTEDGQAQPSPDSCAAACRLACASNKAQAACKWQAASARGTRHGRGAAAAATCPAMLHTQQDAS